MSRPPLTERLSVEDFQDFYWLKEELVAFCRHRGIPTSGPKVEVAERVAAFLRDGTVLRPAPRRSVTVDPIPDKLTRETEIGRGWSCGKRLRAFFEGEVGPAFRFNRASIDVVKSGPGRTLGDALDAWAASKSDPSRPIEPQLEYNRHTRAYYREHPGASRRDVLDAWKEKRSARRSDWSDVSGSPGAV